MRSTECPFSLDSNVTHDQSHFGYYSLEKANVLLLEDLRQTEFEYNSLQNEVRVLNDRLINFRNEHVLELGKTYHKMYADQKFKKN